ncbi:MAG TPA: DUF4123 domain-containing protein [Flavobacteriales bacterium]|nr:DUF4123 domain-containing protein [Flavobacteriales bacterium]HMZ47476.1 DUF4123 domain-containing protein [Flavobacteriales bacterium]
MNDIHFVMLDAARMHGDIYQAREMNPEHICLYEGDSAQFLGAVAPWLFSFQPGTDFATWTARHGRGNSWGVFFRSSADPQRIYQHLRKFLVVRGEDGKEMFFRYYDPRVMRVFLPTCDEAQLKEFFGPIQAFLVENDQGLLVEYALKEGRLGYTETGLDLLRYFNVQELPPPQPVPLEQVGTPSAPEPPAPLPPPQQPSQRRSVDTSNEPSSWDFGY